MKHYLLNPLCYVWAFLVVITVAAWWLSQSAITELQGSALITVSVLLISAVKMQFVMRYFMEIGTGPKWLRFSAEAWLVTLMVSLMMAYFGFA